MDYASILGTTFVAHFTNADKYPLLVVGSDHYSYKEVCDLGVIQPRACRILSRIAADLGARNVKHFFTLTSPYLLAGTHGCGVTTVFVALRVFESIGLPIDEWYAKGQKDALVTFQRLKQRELDAERRTKEPERKRRRLRSRRQVTDADRVLSHATRH